MAGLKKIAKMYGGLIAKNGKVTMVYDGNGKKISQTKSKD